MRQTPCLHLQLAPSEFLRRGFRSQDSPYQDSPVRHTWDVVHAIRLAGKWRLAHEWHGSAAVCRLWRHGESTDHDRDRADVEKDEAEPPDNLDTDQRDLSLRLPNHVA